MASILLDLPTEIQDKVFGVLRRDKTTIKECILVCGSWKRVFQPLLYSSVSLRRVANLSNILNTLEKSQHLSGLVKRLSFFSDFNSRYDPSDYNLNSKIAKLFTHLPNLVRIDCSEGGYFILLDALSTNHLSSLNYVEPSIHEGEEMRTYAACAILLKDRLKNLLISDFSDNGREYDDVVYENRKRFVQSRPLFDKLGQFKNLEELCIVNKPDNIIDLIENVTHNCPSLRKLRLELTPNDDSKPSMLDVSNAILSKSLSRTKVKSLYFSNYIMNDTQLIHYVIYKFPQLEKIELWGGDVKISSCLDGFTLGKLLNYLSKIADVTVCNIPYKEQHLLETIGTFWKTLSQTRMLSVKFDFNPYHNCNTLTIDTCNETNFYECDHSHHSVSGLLNANIIENYGRYIDNLILFGATPSDPNLPPQTTKTQLELLILRPLKYCTKLKNLSMNSYTLSGALVPGYEFIRKQSFDSLKFSMCTIEDTLIFERLSRCFASVKNLSFGGLQLDVKTSRYRDIPFSNINMQETNIGTLSLGTVYGRFDESEHSKLLVIIVIQGCCRYYIHDYGTMGNTFEQVSRQTFYEERDTSEHYIIGIACKSLKKLEMNHLNKDIKLTVN